MTEENTEQNKVAADDGSALSGARRALLELRLRQRRTAQAAADRIVPVAREGLLPVTEQQGYLWFLHQIAPDVPAYNVPFTLRLRGRLEREALGEALRALVARHEGLRTRFGSERGVPFQIIDPPPADVPLGFTDLSGQAGSGAQRLDRALEQAAALHGRPFDLATGPLLRCWLARLGADDHLLAICVHHIVTDGWSTGIITRDLAALYDAALTGKPADLPDLPLAPVDIAAWQRRRAGGKQLEGQLDYWRGTLANVHTVDFPADRQRPPVSAWTGESFIHELPAGLIEQAKRLAAAENAALLAVLTAALTVVLSRHAGQDDITLGSVFSGRTRTEIEPLVGFFANTLVLRANLAENPTGRELIARCNDTVLGALAHQDIPFGTMVEALRPDRVAGRNPLFQISFNLLTDQIFDTFRFGDLDVQMLPAHSGTSRFDLAMQLSLHPSGSAELWVEYATELFNRTRIERLTQHFRTALESLIADPGRPARALEILPPSERELLTEVWNPPPVEFGTEGRLLHELVAEHAVAAPGHTAVRFEGTDLSYGELDSLSSRLAWQLQKEHGVGPDTVVGFLLNRGPEVATAQLGVLKAGGAWLPLDPAHPAGRIAYQLADAAVRAVITTQALAAALPAEVPRILLDDPADAERLAQWPDSPPHCAALPEHVAYVIYTSGSTGAPKGVQVTHCAAVNFVGGAAGLLFSITPGDRVLQFANPTFDVSVFDVYAALCSGAVAVAAPVSVLHDPAALADLMRREAVTIADIPPAVLGVLSEAELPDLRALFVGLEAFSAELVNRWRTPTRAFHNGYGPTEATVACVDYECPAEPLTAPPPIGRAMANMRAFVLDRDGRLAPVGVPGELCVSGAQLARGYLGQPGLTADRFIPCPFGEPGTRMYRTGDVVRWLEHGQLEFLGRVDRQIKIRGLRIELGEIEHTLAGHPALRAATVVVTDADGGPRLDAYLVGADGLAPAEAELRGYLADRLPLHMVPATFTTLETLPLTSSGKLDRKALPRPAAQTQSPEAAPLQTQTQRTMARIWAELLGLPADTIGRQQNFFTLGGSSLQATQLISRIRDAFFIDIDARQLFTRPLLYQIAELADEAIRADVDEEELAGLEGQVAGLSEEELDRLLAAEGE
jgi:amino acid adenylation domain-containing protein